jgi:hypothetical protein
MGCMVPQLFAARGNRSYLEFWAVTGSLRSPGYLAPTVAPEPSVELVAGAGHSMVGRIGTHMLLWVPTRDSLVRLWGQSLHSYDMESHGGTHHVAPEAVSELEA